MRYIKNSIAMLIAFFMIYPMYFVIIPKIATQLIYHILPVIYLIYAGKNTKKFICDLIVDRYSKFAFITIYTCILISLIKCVFQNLDFSYFIVFVNIISGFFRFTAIYIFILRNFQPNKALSIFIRIYVLISCIYVLASIIMLLNMDLRMSWQALLLIENNALDVVNDEGMYVTRFGLQGWSGYTNTLTCSLGIMLLLIGLKQRLFSNGWMFSLPLLMVGNFFYGRIGIIASIIIFLLYIVSDITASKIKILALLVVGACIIFMIRDNAFELYPYLINWMNWVSGPMEAFIEGLQNGNVDFGSSGNITMKKMYFMPESDNTIFWGDGIYTNADGSYYGHTDVGFMRNILYGGVLCEVILYSSFLALLLGLMKDKMKFAVMMYFCIWLIFEIKGEAYQFTFGLFVVMYSMLKIKCLERCDGSVR